MLALSGRTVLVTGGGRGIGRATTLLLASQGARVAVNYVRDAAGAAVTVDEATTAGGVAQAFQADVSVPEETARLFDAVESALGPVDTLVVNHGIWKRAPLADLTPDLWAETLGANLDGAYLVCREAARRFGPRGAGTIVLVASTSGQRGEAHYSHYSASKGAILSFTKSLASELGPAGVRVNCVAPGWVLTDMTREALRGDAGVEAIRSIPTGRPARPEEIAGPIAFLCSPLSSYMYGEVLSVNGGAVMD
jgi:3-oxoacyl-[acyl-carrier protein] reductase